jgi:DNA polymerase
MMEGFFTSKEIECKSRPDGKKYSCAVCGLYKTAEHPKIQPFGNFKKGILNIGQAPNELEDKLDSHWKGRAGKVLQTMYKRLGIDLYEDCLNVNACHCRPVDEEGNDRTPSTFEVSCCRKTTLQIIEQYHPKVIILLGDSAVYSVIGHRYKKELDNIHKWRGWTIPDQDFKTWICPTFHPRTIVDSKTGAEEVIWMRDLEEAFKLIDTTFPVFKEPDIQIIDDLSVLNKIRNKEIAFDYETTGLKPHAIGHRIVCCAIAVNDDLVYSFIMPKSKKERQPFVNLLADKTVMKIAHNMKFEETWSRVRLRQRVINWLHDTMVFAHIADNRPGITSLKFQTYVNFGVVDYASEITPYLISKDSTSNGINRIDELLNLPNGDFKLLKYCAMDAITEYRLFRLQQSLMLPF